MAAAYEQEVSFLFFFVGVGGAFPLTTRSILGAGYQLASVTYKVIINFLFFPKMICPSFFGRVGGGEHLFFYVYPVFH